MPTNSVKRTSSSRAARMLRKAADKGEWVACYDANGKLIGICDPSEITPVSDGGSDAEEAEAAPGKEAEPGAAEDPQAMQKRMAEVRKAVYTSPTAAEQNEVAERLNRAAIVGLDIIHGRRRGR